MFREISALTISALLFLLLTGNASADSWWEKSKGGWNGDESETEAPAPKVKKKVQAVQAEEETPAATEEAPAAEAPKPKIKTRKRFVRGSASVADGGSENSIVVKRKRRAAGSSDNILRLNLLGGYSAVAGAGSTGGGVIQAGLGVDYRHGYIGAELDGYYGIGMGLSPSTDNNASLSGLNQYGGLLAVKGQIPFYTGSIKWIPKLGVGYGMLSEQLSLASSIQTTKTTSSISGVFGVAGLEIQPVRWLVIDVDYAMSVMGNGNVDSTVTVTGIPDQTSTTPVNGGGFQRIRAGAHVRVSDNFNVGAKYVQRTLNLGDMGTETQSQILGLIGLEF